VIRVSNIEEEDVMRIAAVLMVVMLGLALGLGASVGPVISREISAVLVVINDLLAALAMISR
jgi:hypothetical protein